MSSDRPLYAQTGETRYDTLSLLCDNGSLLHQITRFLYWSPHGEDTPGNEDVLRSVRMGMAHVLLKKHEGYLLSTREGERYMSVGKACTRSVVTVRPEETVHEAAKRMAHHEVGTLVVVEGHRPVGMLTDRDLVIRVMAKEPPPLHGLVRDVMTPDPVCIPEHMPLAEALVRMRGHQVRRLVVVNVAKEVVGLVSLDDMLRLLGEEQQAIAGLMRAARSRNA